MTITTRKYKITRRRASGTNPVNQRAEAAVGAPETRGNPMDQMEAATQRDPKALVDPENLVANNQGGLARDEAADLALTRAITAVNQVVALEAAHHQKVRGARMDDRRVVSHLVINVILTSFTLHAAARNTCIALAHVTEGTVREKASRYLIAPNNNTMQL